MKRCARCKHDVPVSEFRAAKGSKDGLDSWCRPCHRVYARERWQRDHERLKALGRDAQLRRDYGINQADYDALLASQGGCCAICGRETCTSGKSLSVDHDHATGAVRGILCGNCNKGLGNFQDSPELLARAIEYLKAG